MIPSVLHIQNGLIFTDTINPIVLDSWNSVASCSDPDSSDPPWRSWWATRQFPRAGAGLRRAALCVSLWGWGVTSSSVSQQRGRHRPLLHLHILAFSWNCSQTFSWEHPFHLKWLLELFSIRKSCKILNDQNGQPFHGQDLHGVLQPHRRLGHRCPAQGSQSSPPL